MKILEYSLFLIIVLFNLTNAADPFCQPLVPNIDKLSLPKIPYEFQTRIEINIVSQQRNMESFVMYDYYDKKAEILTRSQTKNTRSIYYFDKNEQFTFENGRCSAKRLNESNDNIFFGLVQESNGGINMKPPNYFLHFNNDFPHVFVEQTTIRGIPANHYQSCQNWPELNANVLIDYYFSAPGYKFPIVYFDEPTQLTPLTAMVEGYINMDQAIPTKIKIEYNYFEFRSIVERKSDLFILPEGIYCEGQSYKDTIYEIPDSFSFTEEIIARNYNLGTTSRLNYAYKLKTIRFDVLILNDQPGFTTGPYKFVHDYNSGVGYAVNKDNENCMMFPLGTYPIDRNEILSSSSNTEYLAELKPPSLFFYIDDSYFYAGQRYERDILCDVFISKRTDIMIPNVTADYTIVELYMKNNQNDVDESTDGLEQVVPISVHITVPGTSISIVNHFYDFDSKYNRDRFDISQCFLGKDKILFGIRFGYPRGIDGDNFERMYGRRLAEPFEQALMKTFESLSLEASPLRIVAPRIVAHGRGFDVYSGVISAAPAINHFLKVSNSKIDSSKVKYKFRVDTPDKCAALCLNKNEMNSITNNNNFRCRSYDYCTETNNNDFYCSFYDTILTDQDIIVQNAPLCDHYSKISKDYDSATIDQLYKSINEAAIKKTLTIEYDNGTSIETFKAEEIFDTNLQDQVGGSTSFFTQFDTLFENTDINKTLLEGKNYQTMSKPKSSIDECSRLCITEQTFDCQTMIYSSDSKECVWSSLSLFSGNISDYTPYLYSKDLSNIYIRDPLYNYIEYPFKVTALAEINQADVASAAECAYKCDRGTNKIKCRSFNLCKKDETSFRCILSETNIHNTDKDPNVVFTTLCSHYSKRAIKDFQLVPQTQLGVKPQSKLYNTSIESCAEICAFEDNYLCRSFDYFTDTKTCHLYKENLKDKANTDLGITSNPSCNHYSRLYFEENGVLKNVEALKTKKSNKYNGGAIFGIVIAVIIGGILFGIMLGFVYLKVTKKSDLLPVMKFVNPNYEKQQDSE